MHLPQENEERRKRGKFIRLFRALEIGWRRYTPLPGFVLAAPMQIPRHSEDPEHRYCRKYDSECLREVGWFPVHN